MPVKNILKVTKSVFLFVFDESELQREGRGETVCGNGFGSGV